MVSSRAWPLKRIAQAILFLIALAVLSGCHVRPQLYYWGSYEGLIYDMYLNPGEAEPGVQIVRLTEDIQRCESEGMRVPPGVHAHLGYMYFVQGNQPLALREFETERALFPESTKFINGLIARLKRN